MTFSRTGFSRKNKLSAAIILVSSSSRRRRRLLCCFSALTIELATSLPRKRPSDSVSSPRVAGKCVASCSSPASPRRAPPSISRTFTEANSTCAIFNREWSRTLRRSPASTPQALKALVQPRVRIAPVGHAPGQAGATYQPREGARLLVRRGAAAGRMR